MKNYIQIGWGENPDAYGRLLELKDKGVVREFCPDPITGHSFQVLKPEEMPEDLMEVAIDARPSA